MNVRALLVQLPARFWGFSEMQLLPTTSPIMQMVISVGGRAVTTALEWNVNVNRTKVGI